MAARTCVAGSARQVPRRLEEIAVVDAEAELPAHDEQRRDLDAFVLTGSQVIYLRRRSARLLAAEYRVGLTC